MNKIVIILAILLIIGCSPDERDCCIIIDTAVTIKYVNEEGENLFEPDNGLTTEDITLYYKINDEWVKYFKGKLDSTKGIRIDEREDGSYLTIFPGKHIVAERYSETKIEFSESDSDILRTEITKSNSNEFVTKVWYNDELKWVTGQSERMIEIVK